MLLLISIHVIKVKSARHISFELVNPTKVIKKWQGRNILNMHSHFKTNGLFKSYSRLVENEEVFTAFIWARKSLEK